MRYYHGNGQNKRYFEGWYFKHQSDKTVVAFIPGLSIDSDGNKSAFIQVITPEMSCNFLYPPKQFHANPDKLKICVADNVFCEDGISVNLNNETMSISGKLKYGKFNTLKRDAMGPFRFIPFMQCNHGVISLQHEINGTLKINGKNLGFDSGLGYIETDWGSSFPKNYLWVQSSRSDKKPLSIMLSIADIPLLGTNFKGCIGIVWFDKKEYRLSTYNGVKILKCSKYSAAIKQGKYKLLIDASPDNAKKLLAPSNGLMCREIHENACCKVRSRFFIKDELLFDFVNDKAGYEYVE
ncbi:MAG: tocopherol cyclase family protein [Oscillospiraceae bacterium]|jgi:tocopherol cyclase|nr:tocopherol cyclase family protein [Oscillospiraceae bacterium]